MSWGVGSPMRLHNSLSMRQSFFLPWCSDSQHDERTFVSGAQASQIYRGPVYDIIQSFPFTILLPNYLVNFTSCTTDKHGLITAGCAYDSCKLWFTRFCSCLMVTLLSSCYSPRLLGTGSSSTPWPRLLRGSTEYVHGEYHQLRAQKLIFMTAKVHDWR